MTNEEFAKRLSNLRIQKGVSARDMSLSIGQNPGYINSIESGKALPSMTVFFYICEYLNISPRDFFDTEIDNPEKTDLFITYINKLNGKQTEHLIEVVKDIIN